MNIHEPSVGSASHGPSSSSTEEAKSVLGLISKKDEIEAELTALGQVLESVSHLKMSHSQRHLVAKRLILLVAWRQYGYEPHHLGRVPKGRLGYCSK